MGMENVEFGNADDEKAFLIFWQNNKDLFCAAPAMLQARMAWMSGNVSGWLQAQTEVTKIVKVKI